MLSESPGTDILYALAALHVEQHAVGAGRPGFPPMGAAQALVHPVAVGVSPGLIAVAVRLTNADVTPPCQLVSCNREVG